MMHSRTVGLLDFHHAPVTAMMLLRTLGILSFCGEKVTSVGLLPNASFTWSFEPDFTVSPVQMAMSRPRRDVRQPRYLDDFLVSLPRRQLRPSTLYDHSTEGATPYPPAPVISPAPVTAPQNLSSDAVLSALQEMKEDNNQLRREMQNLFTSLSLRSDPHHPTPRQRAHFDDSAVSYVPSHFPESTSTPYRYSGEPVDLPPPPWPDAYLPPSDDPLPPPPPPISYLPAEEALPPPPPPVSFHSPYNSVLQATPQYVEPYTPPHTLPSVEPSYRGPKPQIPLFTDDDPRQFARLKIALDNILPSDATEHFKYQILVDHLKLEDALLIADSYSNSPTPYSKTMASLIEMYGQPHKLALQRITEVLAEPQVRSGDSRGFRQFGLKVRALVGMLEQLGREGRTELECGSHTSRLLSKLPHELRAQFKRFVDPIRTPIPTLLDFSDWLEHEVRVHDEDIQPHHSQSQQNNRLRFTKSKFQKPNIRPTTVLLGSEPAPKPPKSSSVQSQLTSSSEPPKKYCPYCNNSLHYFNQCPEFKKFSTDQRVAWIKGGKRCWRCGRNHLAAHCYLKAKCHQCSQTHLDILHDVNSPNVRSEPSATETVQPATYYLDPDRRSSSVLLKMVKVVLYNGQHKLETYAILDDGSERTIILHSAAQRLHLNGQKEELALKTIRQDLTTVCGQSVSFSISSTFHPQKRFRIHKAFTAAELGLSKHSHPVEALQKSYRHLRGLPLHSFSQAQPLLLIGSDYPHLLTPVEPVHLGPPGGQQLLKHDSDGLYKVLPKFCFISPRPLSVS
ncbi:hypothetical protein WMY93_003249 [Mugilogobius chulae]|uniref:Peptidase aspartic putative domain-containing protein n=1 Tax=Mugilogobius chulae TaxID=88201 RepID=A0AAW0PW32_9GOBI